MGYLKPQFSSGPGNLSHHQRWVPKGPDPDIEALDYPEPKQFWLLYEITATLARLPTRTVSRRGADGVGPGTPVRV